MRTRFSFAGAVASLSVVALLAGCSPSPQAQAEDYLRANISTLSPRSAEVGGTFRVTAVEWIDADTALVTYEDGHIQLKGQADIRTDTAGVVTMTRIRLDAGSSSSSSSSMDSSSMSASSFSSSASMSSSSSSVRPGSSSSSSVRASSSSSSSSTPMSSSSSSASGRARAAEGEFCGGIAGILCQTGLTCQYEGTYPDAGGTCVR